MDFLQAPRNSFLFWFDIALLLGIALALLGLHAINRENKKLRDELERQDDNMVDLLAMKDAGEIDFDPPRFGEHSDCHSSPSRSPRVPRG